MRYATEASPPDAAFANAEKAALSLIEALQQCPESALTGQATFAWNTRNGDVEIAVQLTNIGTEPLAIPHPDVWSSTSVLIDVTARRNDVPLAQLRNEHQTFLRLTKAQLSGVAPAVVPSKAITIAPQASVALAFKASPVLAKGNYDVWLTFDTPLLDGTGTEVTRVELVSSKQQKGID